ncbi:MAG: hypothetical protein HRT67_06525 [Flavobacteriaceae bacterium]|nr:hypothetical protein [Flavobacteriaceae bacterium]
MKNKLFFFTICICFYSYSQETFLATHKGLSIELPKSFKTLTQEDIKKKYSAYGAIPDVVFEEGNSNISIVSTFISLDESKYESYKEAIIKQYIQPNIEILTNEISIINEKKFIIIKLKITGNDDYNIIVDNLTTDINGKMNTITFTQKLLLSEMNEDKFKKIIQSIRIGDAGSD